MTTLDDRFLFGFKRLFNYLVFSPFLLFLVGCIGQQKEGQDEMVQHVGMAQGTTYSVKVFAGDSVHFDVQDVDSILDRIDASFSTYQEHSTIVKFARKDSMIRIGDHFIKVFRIAKRVYQETEGAFDPTVMPLVDAYGFGPDGAVLSVPDEQALDSILQFVGFQQVRMDSSVDKGQKQFRLVKDDPRLRLDMNAVAQGYSVDVIGRFLEDKGVQNYFIELGGEVRTKGMKTGGKPWRVGIDKPKDDQQAKRELNAVVELGDGALATSGSYRKFYVRDGKKYPHTLDPRTGKTVDHTLLSTTVLAPTCGLADAYATALMVMGTEKSKKFLHEQEQLNGYLIWSDDKGKMRTYTTPGFKEALKEL